MNLQQSSLWPQYEKSQNPKNDDARNNKTYQQRTQQQWRNNTYLFDEDDDLSIDNVLNGTSYEFAVNFL
ncbi:10162_t:CDS:2 [Dentiscutata erythropus]|uniref:10162_t:CDS:1 n=1 Tax=Dentiscutata erythropus TaxID=1348616 RepID=A0A9N8W480_9GLOM|nr:10162_t:CDS:2 [Dentiscutata erythropus]